MINLPTATTAATATGAAQISGYYCPVCLRRVRSGEAERRPHRESCRSGDLEVSLLLCPTCGLALAADLGETTAQAAPGLCALHG
jgi:hypothetical protein